MGNCIEPSQSEIQRARRAKLLKLAASNGSLAGAGVPPNMYPYPMDHYGNPHFMTGGYLAHPAGPAHPPAYLAVDPRTGHGFLVPNPAGVPIHVPYNNYSMGEDGMEYNMAAYQHYNNNNDDKDGRDGREERRSRRQSKQSSKVGNVQKEWSKGGEESNHGDQNYDVMGTVHVHAHETSESQKTHQNGGVGIFTKSGLMDLEAETTDPVIIDFIDPIPPITKHFEQPVTLPNAEYETESSALPNGYLTSNHYATVATIEKQASPVLTNRHSTPSPIAMDIDIFPPKVFEAEEELSPVPDILKRTLSQTCTTSLPSDPVDVVITYSVLGEYELDIVRRLTRQLRLVGLSVWAERLGDSSKARKSHKTAEAILGSKVLIVMLSEGSCGQRFIRDHVAIATMTNISIFPVASEPPRDIKDVMPLELKVQLAPYIWTELMVGNEDSFLFQLRSLARSVQDDVEERINLKSNGTAYRGNLQRQKSLTSQGINATAESFWDVHFGHRGSVKSDRLEHTLQDAYKTQIKETVTEDMQTMLFHSIKNRIAKATTDVYRSDFVGLCQSHDGQERDVWESLVQMAGTIQAVRDVFEVKSTVRHLAVEYTEHFSNPAVLSSLRDLLSDPDPNFRSVAVVSLARCMEVMADSDSQSLESVEKTLEDEDRLVREAGCLALGHLRAQSAVKKLIHIWRNDVISHVREAAKMSLDQIGGQEVIEAMRVTDVLAKEIREMTQEEQGD